MLFVKNLINFLHLQAENTLYKLHTSLLEDVSVTLREMFGMPKGANEAELEGQSDERPITLTPPVTSRKFENLLKWFYGLHKK